MKQAFEVREEEYISWCWGLAAQKVCRENRNAFKKEATVFKNE